ncbi:hypothetical protein DAPPUDRAFT_245831 [Daphnia pulex]|uniref:Uncharacterized protein n=1 Tax=Daphnia pulex TaxID=6669 RepID=E9GP50_DAPPU|nr:hypothetical protein DAPPUDRAFT_245831 [Daphnia pulex]|eukprot:EFX78742.1 hypothetical protein DAPPUDRAFT_245831 [Daphnia pulex]
MYFYADSMQLGPGPATSSSPSAKQLSHGSKLYAALLCPSDTPLTPASKLTCPAYTSLSRLYAALLCPSAIPLSPGSKLTCPSLNFPSAALRCSTLPQ